MLKSMLTYTRGSILRQSRRQIIDGVERAFELIRINVHVIIAILPDNMINFTYNTNDAAIFYTEIQQN